MPAWVWAVAGVVGFASASFFFALAESALFSLGRWRTRRLAEEQPEAGRRVAQLLEAPQDLLATIVLGNTAANASIVAVVLWGALEAAWPWGGTLAAMAGVFGLVLIGGEVVPKTLAVRAPERWCQRVVRPMAWLVRGTRPFRKVAQVLNATLLRAFVPSSVQATPGLSDEEYQEMTEMAWQSGAIGASEKEMIQQILRLDRRTAKDVMRPRSQMAAIPDDLSIEDMVAVARQHRHRRLPMYDETPDTIVGVLNTRALLLDPQADLSEAIEFPSFVPESMNLLRLLKSLQRQQRGLAVVLDEFGGTAGVVTVEDILEELIGQVRGEGEAQGFVMERQGPGKWRVNATMRVEDFRREYPELGEVPDVDTLGGLAIHAVEVVPQPGQVVTWQGLRMTVTAGDERRVQELVIETVSRKGGR